MKQLDPIFRSGLECLGLPCAPEDLSRWIRLTELLHHWNQQINLTGHRDPTAIASRLLLEAAALAQVLPAAGSIADIGSGAGIPGIPIAICRPDTRVWLIEAREKRHYFQRAVVRELGLVNAEPLRGRAEELEPRRCDGAIAQALAKPREALKVLEPWVAPGGWIALATTEAPASLEDSDPSETRSYRAPDGPPRSAWIRHLPTAANETATP